MTNPLQIPPWPLHNALWGEEMRWFFQAGWTGPTPLHVRHAVPFVRAVRRWLPLDPPMGRPSPTSNGLNQGACSAPSPGPAAAGGAWSTAADWTTAGSPTTHAVPQPGDDVVINQPDNIQITLGGNVTVNSVTLTGDTLALQAGATLTTTGAVSNGGTITVNASGQLTVGGGYTESVGATLSMPGGGSGTDPTSNQFANTDFESPTISTNGTTTPASWADWGSSYLSRQYAYTGSQSLQTSGANSGVLQNFAVTPGASYTLSAYAMTPAADPLTGSEEGSLQLIFLTSSGAQISSYAPPNSVQFLSSTSSAGGPIAGSVGSQGWNHFSTTAVAPSNAATVSAILAVGAYNGSGAGGGSVYWDAPEVRAGCSGPVESDCRQHLQQRRDHHRAFQYPDFQRHVHANLDRNARRAARLFAVVGRLWFCQLIVRGKPRGHIEVGHRLRLRPCHD